MNPGRILMAIVALVAACSPTGTEEAFPIESEADEYRLEHQPGLYSVRLRVTVTNPLDRTVYLHRQCGYGDHPSRYLVRAGLDDTRIWLDSGVCITAPLRAPIPLGPGESYLDDVVLRSTESPQANPPITMAMRTGTFRLVYGVQLTDRVEGWHPVSPLPTDRTMSNAFTIASPGAVAD